MSAMHVPRAEGATHAEPAAAAESAARAESATRERADDPAAEVHLPHPSLWPAAAGLGITLVAAGFLLGSAPFSLLGLLLAVGAIGAWVADLRAEDDAPTPGHVAPPTDN